MSDAQNSKIYTTKDLLAARLKGRQEAEEFLQARINQICTTNHQLLIEIMRFDKSEAVVGVLIPYEFAEKIIRKLKKRNPKNWHARMIRYYMNKSDAEVFGEPGDIQKELESANV